MHQYTQYSAPENPLLSAALNYAALGWTVFPLYEVTVDGCACGDSTCGSAGKHPRTEHGVKDATRDSVIIRGWWRRSPAANIGIATGPTSGLLMIGPDGEQGRVDLAELERKNGALPPTPTQRSGSGGEHRIFGYPSDTLVRNRRSHRGTKIDIRGDGGFFVVAPSVNANGAYEWRLHPENTNVAVPPDWLLDWCANDRRPEPPPRLRPVATMATAAADRAGRYLARMPTAVSGQGGHDRTFEAARVVVWGFDLGVETGLRLLTEHFNPRCQPPWSEKELRHKCVDADRVPFNKPRGWLLGVESQPLPTIRSDGEPPNDPDPIAATDSQMAVPEVLIGPDEHRVNDEVMLALVADRELYTHGDTLVRVIEQPEVETAVLRFPAGPRIVPISSATLRERLSALVAFTKIQKRMIVPAHPPGWCVSAIRDRSRWPGVRPILAVTDYPVLLADGRVLAERGYHTGILHMPRQRLKLTVPDRPSPADVRAAVALLSDVVCDFPFARDHDRAAFVATLLSALARFAFDGPVPLSLVEANVRAAGKGLLLNLISTILTGRRMAVAVWATDQDELRKRITALIIRGELLCLFDNLVDEFGGAVIDALLTSTVWEDRVLGESRTVRLPNLAIWTATGNNVAVVGDTARRILPIRLESEYERPEELDDFKHPDLLGYAQANRPALLSAALTLLRGYVADGWPDTGLPAWGSYEKWSYVVRNTVVWAGLPDPADGRNQMRERGDSDVDAMRTICGAWQVLDADETGLTAAQVVERIDRLANDGYPDLAESLATLVPGPPETRSTRLGYRFRQFRRRNVSGCYLDQTTPSGGSNRWVVRPAAALRPNPRLGDGGHGGHPPPDPEIVVG